MLLYRLMCVFVQIRTERGTRFDRFDSSFSLVTGNRGRRVRRNTGVLCSFVFSVFRVLFLVED